MSCRRRAFRIRAIFIVLIALIQPDASTPLAAQEIRVVANFEPQSRPIPLSTLRAIFSMRMRVWPDGTPIKVFVLPSQHPLHQRFCKEKLRVYCYVLSDQWDRLLFTGTGRPPEVVESEKELLEKVRSTPGAIGYTSHVDPQAESLIVIGRQITSRVFNTRSPS